MGSPRTRDSRGAVTVLPAEGRGGEQKPSGPRAGQGQDGERSALGPSWGEVAEEERRPHSPPCPLLLGSSLARPSWKPEDPRVLPAGRPLGLRAGLRWVSGRPPG